MDVNEYMSKHLSCDERLNRGGDIIDNVLKISRIQYDLSKTIPRCTCVVVCRDVPSYIQTHVNDIAGDCKDTDLIREYLASKACKIHEMLNGEHFARLKREMKAKIKAARVAAGLPAVQTQPKTNVDRNIPCLKGIDCTYPRCKWLHPEGRTVVQKTTGIKKQACWFASTCPDRFTNKCPFYHDPNRTGYDHIVVMKKYNKHSNVVKSNED
jgi:hypothetical protein